MNSVHVTMSSSVDVSVAENVMYGFAQEVASCDFGQWRGACARAAHERKAELVVSIEQVAAAVGEAAFALARFEDECTAATQLSFTGVM